MKKALYVKFTTYATAGIYLQRSRFHFIAFGKSQRHVMEPYDSYAKASTVTSVLKMILHGTICIIIGHGTLKKRRFGSV